LQSNIQAVTTYLENHGYSHTAAGHAAYGFLYTQLQRQASFLAFMDCFRVIAVLTISLVPLIFLVKKFAPAAKAPEGGH
jgi:DHA2 family multidrug resistance protein